MFSLLFCLFFVHSGFSQPSLSLDPAKSAWFRDARFGIFVHWGLYSMLEGSYNGHTLPDTTLPEGRSWYAEWVQMRLEVPAEEYRALARSFNPTDFDADAWIREVKNAGARYFVITSKHHDGFALWDSDVSDFDVMNTPFKRDILAELVAACKKHGVKYGFYYSHWQDWEHPQGALPYWKPKRPDKDFEKYWREKSLPQVKELLVKFDPDLLWFDTWDEVSHITDERRDELIALVRSVSPKCLINGRISYLNPGENIDFLEMHDNQYPASILSKPWQTPATMVRSWGWHAQDFNWKSIPQMTEYLVSNASKGGNYLLNIGPKPDGNFPVPAIRRLREIGAWLYANGEAVYGTSPVQITPEEGVIFTQKKTDDGARLYITLTAPKESVELPVEYGEVTGCAVLESGRPLEVKKSPGGIRIPLPDALFNDCSLQVICLRMKNTL